MTDEPAGAAVQRHVLVAEDNEAHRIVLRRVMRDVERQSGVSLQLAFVGDGADLLARLEASTADVAGAPGPDIILLDLHMPGMSGLETLRALSDDRRFRFIPVVVLSSSDQPHHVDGAYSSGANAYLVKLGNYDALVAQMRSFTDFWLNAALLPGGPAGGAQPA